MPSPQWLVGTVPASATRDCRVCRVLGFDDEQLRGALLAWLVVAVVSINAYDLWLLARALA